MLRDRFMSDLKEAMKAGDKGRLGTIRLIQSALKDKDIEARGNGKEPLGDEEILQLLQKMVKQRQESARLYTEGNRPSSPPRKMPRSPRSAPICRSRWTRPRPRPPSPR